MNYFKTSAVLAILLTFAIPAVSIQHQPSGTQTAQQGQGDTHHTDLPPVPVTNNQATNYYQQPREDKPHGWHKLVTWPEGITAWAIVLTLGAIIWQAIETRRAVGATRDSITSQEVAYYQWLELSNWRARFPPQTGDLSFNIRVDITNNTDYPLTINDARISFGHKERLTYSPGENTFLVPKTPHVVDVMMRLSEDQLHTLSVGTLYIEVKGHITYTGVLKHQQTQKISGTLRCGIQGSVFESDFPMTPTRQTEEAHRQS